ncbi:hypothetical protein HK099_003574 [Clydaea vesicula]|uniref:Cilia- and flagella-associated protein 263 n=1 Tax=Clydaea vesicula TaxID=447962 RepID=A0AAD5XW66_9FUNG|nr:hypothetical protein HK099_003574 [Clydaea vesicula]KAJ3390500.1 hypothetical protein HDU92_000433 [Lobulomyces angularis]
MDLKNLDSIFDDMDDAELLTLKEETEKKTKFLESENKLFESYLLRVSPNALRVGQTRGGNNNMDELNFNPLDFDKKVEPENLKRREERKKKKGEKLKEDKKDILLTLEQKSEIATRELEELRDEIEKQKDEWGKVLDNLKAEMEEVDIRVSEVKKAQFEFRRDIVQQAINQRTGKVVAERVLRYFEDKIRAKDTIIEKVRLKNATLKVQKNKLHLQLKQKEEMGEVLHAIDFDQLQIENKQYMAKIEERNNELLKLKKSAGNTVQILNVYKQKLLNLTLESINLKKEIKTRIELLKKLKIDGELVMLEKEKSLNINLKTKSEIGEYRVPLVLDYVELKYKQLDLQKNLKSWERKVEISKMQTNRVKSIWKSMLKQSEYNKNNNINIGANRIKEVF